MKNCNHCDGCGCQKCLGFGVDLSNILTKIKNPVTQKSFLVEEYDTLTVINQRIIKNLILRMILIEGEVECLKQTLIN